MSVGLFEEKPVLRHSYVINPLVNAFGRRRGCPVLVSWFCCVVKSKGKAKRGMSKRRVEGGPTGRDDTNLSDSDHEDPDVQGFTEAAPEVLKQRKILTAKRRGGANAAPEAAPSFPSFTTSAPKPVVSPSPNPFGGFSLLGSGSGAAPGGTNDDLLPRPRCTPCIPSFVAHRRPFTHAGDAEFLFFIM